MSKRTREEWMNRLVEEFRPDFKRIGKPLPERIRCSVGFPYGVRAVGPGAAVGQCFMATMTKDKKPQVFVSPVEEDAFEVAHTIVHELVHACGIPGHKADFARVAVELGLTGKMTCSVPGPQLADRLNKIIKKLGPYDHSALDPQRPKKQGTRLVKVICPDKECLGYNARMTRKWLNTSGPPSCPCGATMVEDSGDGE